MCTYILVRTVHARNYNYDNNYDYGYRCRINEPLLGPRVSPVDRLHPQNSAIFLPTVCLMCVETGEDVMLANFFLTPSTSPYSLAFLIFSRRRRRRTFSSIFDTKVPTDRPLPARILSSPLSHLVTVHSKCDFTPEKSCCRFHTIFLEHFFQLDKSAIVIRADVVLELLMNWV